MQCELKEVKQLRELEARQRKLRDAIVARIENGELVEPGDLEAKLSQRTLGMFSFRQLAMSVGEEEARRIRETIGPPTYTCLLINERPSRWKSRFRS